MALPDAMQQPIAHFDAGCLTSYTQWLGTCLRGDCERRPYIICRMQAMSAVVDKSARCEGE